MLRDSSAGAMQRLQSWSRRCETRSAGAKHRRNYGLTGIIWIATVLRSHPLIGHSFLLSLIPCSNCVATQSTAQFITTPRLQQPTSPHRQISSRLFHLTNSSHSSHSSQSPQPSISPLYPPSSNDHYSHASMPRTAPKLYLNTSTIQRQSWNASSGSSQRTHGSREHMCARTASQLCSSQLSPTWKRTCALFMVARLMAHL